MKAKNKSGQNPLTYMFAKIWRYSEGNRKTVVLVWLMFIIAGSISVFVSPQIWAKILNTVQLEGVTSSSIKKLAGLLALVLVSKITFWVIHGPARVFERQNAFKVRLNYRKFLLKGIMSLPMEWHAERQSGDTIDKVEKGTGALYSFTSESFEAIYTLVSLVGSLAMLTYFFPPAALMIVLMMILSGYIVTRFDKAILKNYVELNRAENQISASVFDSISNISSVIILRVERLVFKAIVNRAESPYKLYKKTSWINETKWSLISLSCTVMVIVVLGIYLFVQLGKTGGVMVGSFFLLYRYLETVSDVFGRFTGMYSEILIKKTKVMNSEVLAEDFKEENFANHVLPPAWKILEVNDLNFSYSNGKAGKMHLEGVNMQIKKGERIALVGKSGSGKTTLLKIMRDLYRPKGLKLKVDGVELLEGFTGIARAISLIPQNPEIFATTILENITLGAEHDIEFVKRFTDMASFTRVAESLPNGFDSSINEKGVNLSGGQQQRLAVSRGLLACHDKDIVLLDEPTSSLDVATENRVYQSIFREFKEKTIISSIHRLHLLPQFDRIYFFDKGHIIANGSFEELRSSCPQFREQWEHYAANQKWTAK